MYVSKLDIPPYKFANDGIDYIVPRGLRFFGPLKRLVGDKIEANIFYLPRHRDHAKKLKEGLINPQRRYLAPFTKFSDYFKCDLNLNLIEVQCPSSGIRDFKQEIECIVDTVLSNISDIPIIIYDQTPRSLENNPYVLLKAKLIEKGQKISQIVTSDLISDTQRFCWSLLPIALQIFTKLRGLPYVLARNIGRAKGNTVIIGFGMSRIETPLRPEYYAGFSVAFWSNGVLLFTTFMKTKYEREKLPDFFYNLLSETINHLVREKIISRGDIHQLDIIIHYSGKNISLAEEKAIWIACEEVTKKFGITTKPTILKIIFNNNYRVFTDEEALKNYPEIGSFIELIENKLYILNTTGYNPILNKITLRGSPRPILISIKNNEFPDAIEPLYSVLSLARINYSGMQPKRVPATVDFARAAANLYGKITLMLGREPLIDKFDKYLWFI